MPLATRIRIVAFVVTSSLLLFGCGTESPSSATTQEAVTQEAVTRAPVASIVFVDQAECCKCTRTRINTSWDALKSSLEKSGQELPIRRIHADKAEELAAPFLAMEPMMVVPGLYFLDAQGELVEMLQGEVVETQIMALLPKERAGLGYDGPSLNVAAEHRSCEKDEDCKLVMTQCSCDCGTGVNAEHYGEYDKQTTEMCADYSGMMCKMKCAEVKCIESKCTHDGH